MTPSEVECPRCSQTEGCWNWKLSIPLPSGEYHKERIKKAEKESK